MAQGNVIRGLTIKIDGDSRNLSEELTKGKKQIKDLKDEATALKANLKTGWNLETFDRAVDIAKQNVAATEKQVELLQRALADLDGNSSEEAAEQVKRLGVQLIQAETAAAKAKKQLSDIAGTEFSSKLKSADSQIKSTETHLKALQGSLALKWDEQKFSTAQQLARDALSKTEEKAKLLREELAQMESEGSTVHTQEEFDKLTAKIAETETAVQGAVKQLQEVNQLKLDRVTSSMNAVGNAMLKGGAVATAGITLPLVAIGKQALETASDLVEVQNVVDTSFKGSAGTIDAWSQSLLESVGMSELSAKQYAGLYKAMANGMEVADGAGTEMAQQLTELTGDLASFYNVKQEVAGTALKSIFTGETETLKQFGVVMTEANLNAYALSHGMEQMSTDMSQAEKVSLRYNFVMNAMNDVHGDFARTIDSEANQARLAQERIKALSADFAKELLPVATDVLKWANDMLKSFGQMSEKGKKTTLMVLGLAAGMGPAVTLLGGMAKGAAGVTKAIGKSAEALTRFKEKNNAATISQAALNAVMSANPYAVIASILAAVTVAVGALAIATNDVGRKTKELRSSLDDISKSYESAAQGAQDTADKQRAEMDIADRLIERYEELNGKVNKSAEEKAELQSIVSQLNDMLGIEISVLNAEALQFDATAASLRNLTQARREDIAQMALQNRAVAAQEALSDLQPQVEEAQENYEKAKQEKEGHSWGPSFGIGTSNAAAPQKDMQAKAVLDDLLEKQRKLQEKVDEYVNFKKSVPSETSGMTQSQAEAFARQKERERESSAPSMTYKEAKEDLDKRMDLGMETERTYYDKLVGLREQYFSNASSDYREWSDELVNLNKEIYNEEAALRKSSTSSTKSSLKEQTAEYKASYNERKKIMKEAYEQEKKHQKEQYENNKKALEQAYKDEVAAVENTLKAKEKAINAEIKAIDKEIEARKRLKQEEEYTSKADSLRAQLAYGKLDDFSRRELEAELQRVLDEEADYKWELEQEDRKDALNEELDAAKELAEQQKAELQENYELAKIAAEQVYNQQMEFLETEYQLHLDQLETMFQMSSTELGKISQSFADTIAAGCQEAADILSSILDRTEAATDSIVAAKTMSVDNSTRNASLYLSSGYTEGQARRLMERYLYD